MVLGDPVPNDRNHTVHRVSDGSRLLGWSNGMHGNPRVRKREMNYAKSYGFVSYTFTSETNRAAEENECCEF